MYTEPAVSLGCFTPLQTAAADRTACEGLRLLGCPGRGGGAVPSQCQASLVLLCTFYSESLGPLPVELGPGQVAGMQRTRGLGPLQGHSHRSLCHGPEPWAQGHAGSLCWQSHTLHHVGSTAPFPTWTLRDPRNCSIEVVSVPPSGLVGIVPGAAFGTAGLGTVSQEPSSVHPVAPTSNPRPHRPPAGCGHHSWRAGCGQAHHAEFALRCDDA